MINKPINTAMLPIKASETIKSSLALNHDMGFAGRIIGKYASNDKYFFEGISLTYLIMNREEEQESIESNPVYISLKLLLAMNYNQLYEEVNSRNAYMHNINKVLENHLTQLRLSDTKGYEYIKNIYQLINTGIDKTGRQRIHTLITEQLQYLSGYSDTLLTKEQTQLIRQIENRNERTQVRNTTSNAPFTDHIFERNVINHVNNRTDVKVDNHTDSNTANYATTNLEYRTDSNINNNQENSVVKHSGNAGENRAGDTIVNHTVNHMENHTENHTENHSENYTENHTDINFTVYRDSTTVNQAGNVIENRTGDRTHNDTLSVTENRIVNQDENSIEHYAKDTTVNQTVSNIDNRTDIHSRSYSDNSSYSESINVNYAGAAVDFREENTIAYNTTDRNESYFVNNIENHISGTIEGASDYSTQNPAADNIANRTEQAGEYDRHPESEISSIAGEALQPEADQPVAAVSRMERLLKDSIEDITVINQTVNFTDYIEKSTVIEEIIAQYGRRDMLAQQSITSATNGFVESPEQQTRFSYDNQNVLIHILHQNEPGLSRDEESTLDAIVRQLGIVNANQTSSDKDNEQNRSASQEYQLILNKLREVFSMEEVKLSFLKEIYRKGIRIEEVTNLLEHIANQKSLVLHRDKLIRFVTEGRTDIETQLSIYKKLYNISRKSKVSNEAYIEWISHASDTEIVQFIREIEKVNPKTFNRILEENILEVTERTYSNILNRETIAKKDVRTLNESGTVRITDLDRIITDTILRKENHRNVKQLQSPGSRVIGSPGIRRSEPVLSSIRRYREKLYRMNRVKESGELLEYELVHSTEQERRTVTEVLKDVIGQDVLFEITAKRPDLFVNIGDTYSSEALIYLVKHTGKEQMGELIRQLTDRNVLTQVTIRKLTDVLIKEQSTVDQSGLPEPDSKKTKYQDILSTRTYRRRQLLQTQESHLKEELVRLVTQQREESNAELIRVLRTAYPVSEERNVLPGTDIADKKEITGQANLTPMYMQLPEESSDTGKLIYYIRKADQSGLDRIVELLQEQPVYSRVVKQLVNRIQTQVEADMTQELLESPTTRHSFISSIILNKTHMENKQLLQKLLTKVETEAVSEQTEPPDRQLLNTTDAEAFEDVLHIYRTQTTDISTELRNVRHQDILSQNILLQKRILEDRIHETANGLSDTSIRTTGPLSDISNSLTDTQLRHKQERITDAGKETVKQIVDQYITKEQVQMKLSNNSNSKANNELSNQKKEIKKLQENLKVQNKVVEDLKKQLAAKKPVSEKIDIDKISSDVMKKMERQIMVARMSKGLD